MRQTRWTGLDTVWPLRHLCLGIFLQCLFAQPRSRPRRLITQTLLPSRATPRLCARHNSLTQKNMRRRWARAVRKVCVVGSVGDTNHGGAGRTARRGLANCKLSLPGHAAHAAEWHRPCVRWKNEFSPRPLCQDRLAIWGEWHASLMLQAPRHARSLGIP